ncbi:MAG: hypothetical protein K8R77_02690 [Anaerolineaceae bacterium]|nr:hypothetical protein [Anaerolineaceae bacterium]
MSNQHEYEIYQCQNTECCLRFPKPRGSNRITLCPCCGSPVFITEEKFTNLKPEPVNSAVSGLSISIALDNLRSAYNVGSIFRTADATGIEHIYLYGITPTPNNPKIQKTSLSAEYAVPWSHHKNGVDHLLSVKEKYQIWALEGGPKACSIFDLPDQKSNQPVLLIFGSEYAGIDPGLLRLVNKTIFIPMTGFKRSLNVASAFSVAAYTIRYLRR